MNSCCPLSSYRSGFLTFAFIAHGSVHMKQDLPNREVHFWGEGTLLLLLRSVENLGRHVDVDLRAHLGVYYVLYRWKTLAIKK